MMKYLQKLGKSLMLPVSILPAAALIIGIANLMTNFGFEGIVSSFLSTAGLAILDNLPILFAIGIALGMTKKKDGSVALSAIVAFFVITSLLAPESVSKLLSIEVSEVNLAFTKIKNPFIGILSGIIASIMFDKFHETELPEFLAFFSGKRLVPIVTSIVMIFVSLILFFVWPLVFTGLSSFGKSIVSLGAIGAGIYGFFNRLLIPFGLHHTLNSLFWFDVIGINDIGRFLSPRAEAIANIPEIVKGTYYVGMYQAGFFPVMMFGLPAAGLAIVKCARPERKKEIMSLMIAAGFASFFTGITEPLEFSFMFVAPILFVAHAVLTGLSIAFAASMHWASGFGFSAGLTDFLLSLANPNANKPLMLIVQGLVIAIIYYVVFMFLIKTFNLLTPGREKEEVSKVNVDLNGADKFNEMAKVIYDSLGGKDNIKLIDNCATRLRIELKDTSLVDEAKVKTSGAYGVNVIDEENVQIIVGPKVEFVTTALKNIHK